MRYNKVVGIGGVGAGMLFHTDDNTQLGRSESRLVSLSDAKDYCKLHIVFHYAAALLHGKASVYPVGFVGKDAQGAALTEEIRAVGMDMTYLGTDPTLPTMLSVCLQYPDKETCNFTVSNSACDRVTPDYVVDCLDKIGIGPGSIVAAIPEVRVESRVRMLQYGREKKAFCVLSIPETEAETFQKADIFGCCDLLALNYGEAKALAPGSGDERAVIERLYTDLCTQNKDMMLLVTCGKKGAFSAHQGRLEFIPYLPAQVVSTAGAGDACLGGTIAGLSLGLPFQKGRDDAAFGDTPLGSAVELGTLCAGMAVETADSIARYVNRDTILARVEQNGWTREQRFL